MIFLKKPLDKLQFIRYNQDAVSTGTVHGGIAQLVEHSVHTRSVICSSQIAATRPVGQEVKTPPFHGGNMGSSPVRVTTKKESFVYRTKDSFFELSVPYGT